MRHKIDLFNLRTLLQPIDDYRALLKIVASENAIMMDTRLHELLEFPCDFTFKVIGDADATLTDKVVAVVQKYLPGDYTPQQKSSGKGNFCSVSITIHATDIHQIETLYQELANIENVKMVL